MLCVADGEFCNFDPLMHEIFQIIIEISVPTAQQTLAISITKTAQSIAYESIALCCENQAERINTQSDEYLEFLEFTAGEFDVHVTVLHRNKFLYNKTN